MNKVSIYLFIICSVNTLFSQAPTIQWQNKIGGSNNDYIANTANTINGYLLGGYSISNISGDKTENSKGRFDYWSVKINEIGTIQWDKTIGGASPNLKEDDVLTCISNTNDGGFLLGGYSDSPISAEKTIAPFNNGDDFWIVKTNSTVGIQWQQVFGGDLADVPTVIKNTADNGYIIGGYSNSNISGNKTENSRGLNDYWILKLDSVGNIQWQKTIGGSGNDTLESIILTSDGGYLIGGSSNSPLSGEKSENSIGLFDYWILKLNSSGTIQWQKTIGGSDIDRLSNITPLTNGSFILTGSSKSNISGHKSENSRGLFDYWIVTIDDFGNVLSDKTIGGNADDNLGKLIVTTDNNYLLTGSSYSTISGDKTEPLKGLYDTWLVKINPQGAIQWQKTIGGSGGDGLNAVFQTADGGYFLSGATDSPISGDITENSIGGFDYWAVKLAPDELSTDYNDFASTQVYPNPTTDFVNITFGQQQEKVTVVLSNILGQTVSKKTYAQIDNVTYHINSTEGIYFLTLENKKGKKMTIKVLKKNN